MKTINLKGKDYAPVGARVEQFHKDHEKGSMTTETTFEQGHVIVKATITFDDRTFTGHSYGKVGAEKAFEKLETTAVGRALAFAGYLAGGEIASYDEMRDFDDTDNDQTIIAEMRSAKTLEGLKAVWEKLSNAQKADPEILAVKEEVKVTLS